MRETEFELKADQLIQDLADWVEINYPLLEVEIYEKILYITAPWGEYVINKHRISKQLWVSSPKTGACYFSFNLESSTWNNIKDFNLTINQFLQYELNEQK